MDMEYEKEISFAETTYRLSAVINTLQSKLVKAEKVIGIVQRMQVGQQLDVELFVAMREYRGDE